MYNSGQPLHAGPKQHLSRSGRGLWPPGDGGVGRRAGGRKEGVARTSSLWPGALQFIDFSSSSSATWPPGAAHSAEKQSVGKKSKERERETFSMKVLLFFHPPRGV